MISIVQKLSLANDQHPCIVFFCLFSSVICQYKFVFWNISLSLSMAKNNDVVDNRRAYELFQLICKMTRIYFNLIKYEEFLLSIVDVWPMMNREDVCEKVILERVVRMKIQFKGHLWLVTFPHSWLWIMSRGKRKLFFHFFSSYAKMVFQINKRLY